VTTHAVSRSPIVELTGRMSCVLKTRFGKVIIEFLFLAWDSARKAYRATPLFCLNGHQNYYNLSKSCFQHTRHSTGQFNDRRATDSMRCHALLVASWPARIGCWAARPGGAATKHRLLTGGFDGVLYIL